MEEIHFCHDLTGVQIVEICLATPPLNGGLIDLQQLCKLLHPKRKHDHESVSEDDRLCAIISAGNKMLASSLPFETMRDRNEILDLAQATASLVFVFSDKYQMRTF
ncbi:vacuolar protein sorting-associated protein 22 homolog 1-like [Hibiscus syriacus]|uniref:vacuolar protein sorting-associated protein 22 homolog 1-like n=1 Tax=Hibiscus syriacus TaxID=106335 RepID=UPI001923BD10|nr:vacuolar protein sorting-associated protein 22 homolog 1-like [Hibiscus syriacus]